MPTYSKMVSPGGGPRTNRAFRYVRAVVRDSTALLTEFRNPIMVFLVTTILGGWLYGQLDQYAQIQRCQEAFPNASCEPETRDNNSITATFDLNCTTFQMMPLQSTTMLTMECSGIEVEHIDGVARVEPIPMVDLPYIMVALMILETPIELPHEWYLILFWYAMPPIAVYIIGRGAADFVRLFLNRSERRDAWEEAVASTYRRHVVVLGVGHVGLGVIRELVKMGVEVVAIETKLKPELDDKLSVMGVPCIVGDGRLVVTLENAGIKHAQAFVGCTSSDYVNLEAVMRVRELRPNIRIATRMWDDKFAHQMKTRFDVSAVMSASDLAAPSFASAAVGIDMTQAIHVNSGEFTLVRLEVEAGSFMDGARIAELQLRENMDIVLHSQGDGVNVQPDGDILVRANETLVMFAHVSQINKIVQRNTAGQPRTVRRFSTAEDFRDHIVVLGVGHVGIRVTRALIRMGFPVVVIDQKLKPDIAQELEALSVHFVEGDGRQIPTLEAAGLVRAAGMLVCTSNDYVNLEVILRARDLCPDVRIVARMWDDKFAHQLTENLGVSHVMSSAELAAPSLAAAALGIEITHSLNINHTEYSLIRIEVEAGSFMADRSINDLQDAFGIDIVLHDREGRIDVHPAGDIIVRVDDLLVMFSYHEQILELVQRNYRATPRRRRLRGSDTAAILM